MKKEFQLSDRREFLADGLRGAALFVALASGRGQAAEKASTANPFAYDVSRLSKTDPKLIAYEEVARWKSPHAEAKRITAGPGDTLYVCAGRYVTAMSRDGVRGLGDRPARCRPMRGGEGGRHDLRGPARSHRSLRR